MKGNRILILIFIIGIICIIAAGVVYAVDFNTSEDAIDWDVTLIGSDGTQKIISYNKIKSMPSVEGKGGFFTSVGVINGPYKIKGVMLKDICEFAAGFSSSDIVYAFATDGYSAVFDYAQLTGDIDSYDPHSMRMVSHGEQKVVLAYEQDGNPLSHEYGKPLRLAVITDDELLTEGHHWVKWINRIEIVKLK